MCNMYIPRIYRVNGDVNLMILKKRYYILILAYIYWMVPLDHSIWEILLAAQSCIMYYYGGWFRAFEFSIKHDLKTQVKEIIDFVKINTDHALIIPVDIDILAEKKEEILDKYQILDDGTVELINSTSHKRFYSRNGRKQ